jgi:predicted kinase
MQHLIILRGLPASGKSTWAREQVRNHANWKRVNKDDLRDMVDDGQWNKVNEKSIVNTRNIIVEGFLRDGFNVIVDDTNLADKHIRDLMDIAERATPEFVSVEIKDFDAPLDELIKRDALRENPVGAKVIKGMYYKYKFKPEERHPKYVEQNQNLPKAIIVDIDGTIALMKDRGPFEWKKVGNDLVNKPVVDFVENFAYQDRDSGSCEIILVSGRDSSCREETTDWLLVNNILYDSLFMRPEGDYRKDVEIKKEIYENHIKDEYNVVAVFDDRNQTVKGWRELGLLTFQVAEGDF